MMRGTHWVTRLRSVCKWFCSVFSLNINSVVVSLRRWFNYRAWMLRPVAAPSTTYTISCLSRPTRSAARRKSSKLYAAYCSPIRSLNLLLQLVANAGHSDVRCLHSPNMTVSVNVLYAEKLKSWVTVSFSGFAVSVSSIRLSTRR